ncbi:hypothetical protein TWF694_006206 [Orbilia ellipsospora]|uniref:Uncharacterized protein n=1 Tax=Orbilia ellipsospora TaxID=2528407 RepID=A0AAV9XJH9_9PEZI
MVRCTAQVREYDVEDFDFGDFDGANDVDAGVSGDGGVKNDSLEYIEVSTGRYIVLGRGDEGLVKSCKVGWEFEEDRGWCAGY